MKRPIEWLGIVAMVAATALPVARADDKDVIEYRQHVMSTLNEQTAALGQILSTAVPDDNAVQHLEAIALAASTALKAFEPKVPGGESKPAVWSNWPDFSKRMNEFAQKTRAAANLAKTDKDSALGNILDALDCKGCHDQYRDEKKK